MRVAAIIIGIAGGLTFYNLSIAKRSVRSAAFRFSTICVVLFSIITISSLAMPNSLFTTIYGQVSDNDTAPSDIILPVGDTTPPYITVPDDITVEATSPNGSSVQYAVTVEDDVDGTADIEIICDHNSGDTFPIGDTTIRCSAEDEAGNQATASFTVTVTDTTAPAITGTRNILVEASTTEGAQVTYTVSAEDNVDGTAKLEQDGSTITQDDVGGSITISCYPPSGFEFPIGNTTIDCTATDASGNEEEGFFTITVEAVVEPVHTTDPLIVEIIPNGTEGIALATFEFQANITGGTEPYTYLWNFGDGSEESDDEQTVLHTFEEAGIYNVTLAATDTDGQDASGSIEITVNESPSTEESLTVGIISNATIGEAPATFEFETNVAGGAQPYTFSWDLDGDGSEDSTEQSVVHTIDEPGTYNITLAATDTRNQNAFDSIEINVGAVLSSPAVEIISSGTVGIAPATFDFEANVIGGLEPYFYSWDFDGDGTEDSNESSISHTFDGAGTYNVAITVTDSNGRTASDSIAITVTVVGGLLSEEFAVDITSSNTVGEAPADFQFGANIIGGLEPYSYSWDFDSDSSEDSNEETVEYTFDEPGIHNVVLTVIDSNGRTASNDTTITVERPNGWIIPLVVLASIVIGGIALGKYKMNQRRSSRRIKIPPSAIVEIVAKGGIDQ